MKGPFCPHCDTPIRIDQAVCTAAPCIKKATEILDRIAADAEANPWRPPRGIVYLDVNGTLDTLQPDAGRALIERLEAAGWMVVVWSGLHGRTVCGRHAERKELRRLAPGAVVVDDDASILRAAGRLCGARTFGPGDLPRLPELLAE